MNYSDKGFLAWIFTGTLVFGAFLGPRGPLVLPLIGPIDCSQEFLLLLLALLILLLLLLSSPAPHIPPPLLPSFLPPNLCLPKYGALEGTKRHRDKLSQTRDERTEKADS